MASEFRDKAAEQACLAGVVRHGRDAFIDCEGRINAGMIGDPLGQVLWSCFEEFYADGHERPPDYPSLLSAARKKGLAGVVDSVAAREYFADLARYPIDLESVEPEAAKILKLAVGRELDATLAGARRSLHRITGDESLNHILALVENPLFDYTSRLNGEKNDTRKIGVGMREWLDNVVANPRENIGIPTPFAKYNKLIGGGFRRRGISIVGARPKCGKSVFIDNVGLHVAGTLNIPVFNLDTEMSDEEHWVRVLAHLTGIAQDRIESGHLTREEADRLRAQVEWVESIPYYYRSVIDETFEEQVAAMRRWIVKTVGVHDDGTRKDCLVLYDYLQLTDPGEFSGNNFKEYQLLGFQMVALSRMAKKYDVPIFSALQLNRDGIDKRTTAAAAGSDRIIWKCANFSILAKWEDTEKVAHPGQGSLWLCNLIARHGPGGDGRNDDIAIAFDGATARMSEGKFRKELERDRMPSTSKGFATDGIDDELSLE